MSVMSSRLSSSIILYYRDVSSSLSGYSMTLLPIVSSAIFLRIIDTISSKILSGFKIFAGAAVEVGSFFPVRG